MTTYARIKEYIPVDATSETGAKLTGIIPAGTVGELVLIRIGLDDVRGDGQWRTLRPPSGDGVSLLVSVPSLLYSTRGSRGVAITSSIVSGIRPEQVQLLGSDMNPYA
jgi:hypothetical protein